MPVCVCVRVCVCVCCDFSLSHPFIFLNVLILAACAAPCMKLTAFRRFARGASASGLSPQWTAEIAKLRKTVILSFPSPSSAKKTRLMPLPDEPHKIKHLFKIPIPWLSTVLLCDAVLCFLPFAGACGCICVGLGWTSSTIAHASKHGVPFAAVPQAPHTIKLWRATKTLHASAKVRCPCFLSSFSKFRSSSAMRSLRDCYLAHWCFAAFVWVLAQPRVVLFC